MSQGAGRGAGAGRLPIFVGGSGLYFKALTRGLSAVPPIPAEVREGVRARLERDGVEALHAELARRDPAAAERLKPRDRTRIARALEVGRGDGPLADRLASRRPAAAAAAGRLPRVVSRPRSRPTLCADRCAVRCDAGGRRAGGGRSARRAALDPLLPAMKAHGVPALIRHLGARSRWTRLLRSAAPTPVTTPSGSSPGSGTSCRNSSGWGRRRQGGGSAASFRMVRSDRPDAPELARRSGMTR